MKKLTLISLYGNKSQEFQNVILHCQDAIATIPGLDFTPYDLRQVHGTILGLNQVPGSDGLNLNFYQFRHCQKIMDIPGLVQRLQNSGHFPFQIQIGGFQPRDYPFTSRGKIPYERSFSLQGNKAVMMGWVIRGKPLTTVPKTPQDWCQEARLYPPTLDQLRQGGQSFGVLHTYHRTLTDVDNDLYFRIGLFNPNTLGEEGKTKVENTLRQFLSTMTPLILNITWEDLCIAVYEDETLPFDSTQTFSLQKVQSNPESILHFYRQK